MLLLFFCYQTAHIILFPFFACYLVFRKIKQKPVFGNFFERIGFVPKTDRAKKVIWLHAVSVGEVLSIQNIIERIKKKDSETICYLTVGTTTGKEIAKKQLNADVVSFIPYDLLPSMWLAYKRINPKKLIIVEAELWPNLIILAHLKKIPANLINARISKRSKKRHHALKMFLLPLLNIFEKIYAQSKEDKKEFCALGVKENKLEVLGNIKAANVFEKWKKYNTTHSPQKNITLLVGSLHPGELTVYLNLYKKIKKLFPSAKLILAPRHFSWKQTLIDKVKRTGFSFEIWDNKTEVRPEFKDILLVCKLGELFKLYQEATIYFLGGTFVQIGGHNLLEPAVWSNPIVIGPYHQNCKVIVKELVKNNGILIAKNEEALEKIVKKLLVEEMTAKKTGTNAGNWLKEEVAVVEKKLQNLLTSI